MAHWQLSQSRLPPPPLQLLKKMHTGHPRGRALQQHTAALLLERLLPGAKGGARSAVGRRGAALDAATVVAAQPWFQDAKALVGGATSGGQQLPRGGYYIGASLRAFLRAGAGVALCHVSPTGWRTALCNLGCALLTAMRQGSCRCASPCLHAGTVEQLLKVCHLLLWPHMLKSAAGAPRAAPPEAHRPPPLRGRLAPSPERCWDGRRHKSAPASTPPSLERRVGDMRRLLPTRRRGELRQPAVPGGLAALPGGLPEAGQVDAARGPGGEGAAAAAAAPSCTSVLPPAAV
jgi:hypothetical protein